MNIAKAIAQAVKENRYITRPEYLGIAKIKPSDEEGNCIVMKSDGSRPSKYGWQPSASDLMNENWMVID